MHTIIVTDMSCMHCVGSIKKVLDANSIKHEIDLNAKTVKVDSLHLAVKVIEQLGFSVKVGE